MTPDELAELIFRIPTPHRLDHDLNKLRVFYDQDQWEVARQFEAARTTVSFEISNEWEKRFKLTKFYLKQGSESFVEQASPSDHPSRPSRQRTSVSIR